MIHQSRKFPLSVKGNTWMKKGRDLFDVKMGTNGGAEVCKLAETFSLEICNM